MTEIVVASDVYDRLQRIMASDPDGFCELYRDYLTDAWRSVASLRLACEHRQPQELRSKAHYLKGSSLVLGLRSLAQCCAEIEQLGSTSSFETASEKLTEVTELLRAVKMELEQRLGARVIPAV